MRDPVLTDNGEFKSHRSKRPEKERCSEKVKPGTHIIKVREDVFILHRTNNVVDRNLLANSISAKLKKDIPGEIAIKADLMNKLRRENLKDYLHLANLNRKFSSEMQWERNRLNSEGNQILKRQEQLRKNSEQSRRNQEKLNVQFENRVTFSNSQSPTLPTIRQTDNHRDGRSDVGYDHIILRDRPNTYPRVPVDKEDASYIKVFKHNGIFQPQNKYPDKREMRKGETGILKVSTQMPDYEIIRLSPVERESVQLEKATPDSPRERKKKGRRVTWSGVDREMDRDTYDDCVKSEGQSPSLSRISSFKSDTTLPQSPRSIKSDSALFQQFQYRNVRSRIETIGLKWKLPPGAKPETTSARSKSAQLGHLSRNLIPCASAMNSVGTSVSRTRWGVPRPQSLDTHDMYKAWLEKLEKLKSPGDNGKFLTAGAFQSEADTRSMEVTIHSLSETQKAALLS
ncbi:hypothetical protein FSP39_022016 [Pinctada imbricata]|uniref:Uncharacterized protein n=1 Tax=Pinctada imbricata TaxID=66713 RepID=A0AA88XNJ1_PINIB|nr:hypothetical protein FSP39_022016 [Pinctada imbricata]